MTAVGVGVGVAAGVVGSLLVLWHAGIAYEVDYKCEKPKYSTVRTLGRRRDFLGRSRPAAEIRRYAPVLVAEVLVEGSGMREALSSGFRQIAGFIFGKNVAPGAVGGTSEKVAMTSPVTLEPAGAPASAKIAMTSPVAAEMAGGGAYKVSFVMPSNYTKETLPTPLNEAVKIVEKPARTLAALTWRGAIPKNSGVVDERVRQLRGLLAEAGVEPVAGAPPHLWQYHPPFAPPYMRVNEVLLEVDEASGTPAAATS